MLINQGSLAAALLIGLGLVSAQVATMAECLETGYTDCWCTCVLSVVDQYCSAAAILTECQCTNLNYRTPMLECVQSSNCPSVSEDISIAEEVCSLGGYSLALPVGFAVSTNAAGGSIIFLTASATAAAGGSAAFTTSAATGGSVAFTTSAATGQSSAASRGSLQPGAIAGIVIGSIAVLVLGIIGIILALQRGSRNNAAAVSL
jgi:hypothetical protein